MMQKQKTSRKNIASRLSDRTHPPPSEDIVEEGRRVVIWEGGDYNNG